MVKIRSRIILSFVLLTSVGFYFLVNYVLNHLRPRYLEAVEEVLVDQANILATFLEADLARQNLDTVKLHAIFDQVYRRKFSAKIYELTKTHVDERVYVTDSHGIVLFDSQGGKEEGNDYSNWRDVFQTLRGGYGARTTRSDPHNPTTSTLHVAAPLRRDGEIVGVVTVSKPTSSINFFLETARPPIMIAGAVAAVSVILLGAVLSTWVTHPIRRLTQYARSVRDGLRVGFPALGSSEIAEMGRAFEEMREALEGKKYIEQYVQSLTHELKSPLAAIQGAAELMEEAMPVEERKRFLQNIKVEAQRMRHIVERMLELASLEARQGLSRPEDIRLAELLQSVVSRFGSLLQKKRLSLLDEVDPQLTFQGEKFLLEQALSNLLQNAIDFSPPGGALRLATTLHGEKFQLSLSDQGAGIPNYALPRIFEKFYSLPRPDSGKKSTGLGLSFVKEVLALHHGDLKLENLPSGGVCATLTLPLHFSPPPA